MFLFLLIRVVESGARPPRGMDWRYRRPYADNKSPTHKSQWQKENIREAPALYGLVLARLIGQAKRLQLAVQRRAFHADERRGSGDVAGEAADLGAQIFTFKGFARFPETRR
jgi:hypothetical protein